MDDLAKKFDGFDAAMTKVLDKLTALEAWKSAASTSMDKLPPSQSARRLAWTPSSSYHLQCLHDCLRAQRLRRRTLRRGGPISST